jgi:hypothetical protein
MQRSDRHKRKDPTKPRARARCSCGKAIYRNAHDAGRDLDRFGLARMYRCDEGRLHLTSGEQDDPPGAYARKRPTPALLTRCPACGALAVWDDATSCAHPVHSRRSAANRARVPPGSGSRRRCATPGWRPRSWTRSGPTSARRTTTRPRWTVRSGG